VVHQLKQPPQSAALHMLVMVAATASGLTRPGLIP
jgi:hypothetical protein